LGLRDYSLTLSYAGSTALAGGYGDPETWANFGASIWEETKDDFTGANISVNTIQANEDICAAVLPSIRRRHLMVGKDKITRITIVGHGSPGDIGTIQAGGKSDITLASLESKTPTSQKQLLAYLQPFTQGSCNVILQACSQAVHGAGQAMMKDIAQQLGSGVNVIGWDSTYAIVGWGNQWTATSSASSGPTITLTKPGVPYVGIDSFVPSGWADSGLF